MIPKSATWRSRWQRDGMTPARPSRLPTQTHVAPATSTRQGLISATRNPPACTCCPCPPPSESSERQGTNNGRTCVVCACVCMCACVCRWSRGEGGSRSGDILEFNQLYAATCLPSQSYRQNLILLHRHHRHQKPKPPLSPASASPSS